VGDRGKALTAANESHPEAARHRRTAERALQMFMALVRQGEDIGLSDSEMALLFGTCDEMRSLIAWLTELERER